VLELINKCFVFMLSFWMVMVLSFWMVMVLSFWMVMVLSFGMVMVLIPCTASTDMIILHAVVTQCNFRNHILTVWLVGRLHVRGANVACATSLGGKSAWLIPLGFSNA
jgi:hypothetical protein